MTAHLRTFLGGPESGRRHMIDDGRAEVVMVEQPELTDMLEASIKVQRGELVAVPGSRHAVYRLSDDEVYRFVGWRQ